MPPELVSRDFQNILEQQADQLPACPPAQTITLTNSGNTITGYRSADGNTWTSDGTISVTFTNSTIDVGLEVDANNNSLLNTSTFDNVALVAGGYFDNCFWTRRVAYPAYVAALLASSYDGYIDWEFCHPAIQDGKPAGIDYVHEQTRLALEYMKNLRAAAQV